MLVEWEWMCASPPGLGLLRYTGLSGHGLCLAVCSSAVLFFIWYCKCGQGFKWQWIIRHPPECHVSESSLRKAFKSFSCLFALTHNVLAGFRTRRPGSLSLLLPVRPWASHFTSPCLSLLIYRMEMGINHLPVASCSRMPQTRTCVSMVWEVIPRSGKSRTGKEEVQRRKWIEVAAFVGGVLHPPEPLQSFQKVS